jgi:hypothetical protein
MSSRPQDYSPPMQLWSVLIEENIGRGESQRMAVSVGN